MRSSHYSACMPTKRRGGLKQRHSVVRRQKISCGKTGNTPTDYSNALWYNGLCIKGHLISDLLFRMFTSQYNIWIKMIRHLTTLVKGVC